MKRLGLLTLALLNSSVFAVNPPSGWYGGLFLGPTYSPNRSYTIDAIQTLRDNSQAVINDIRNNLSANNVNASTVQSALNNIKNGITLTPAQQTQLNIVINELEQQGFTVNTQNVQAFASIVESSLSASGFSRSSVQAINPVLSFNSSILGQLGVQMGYRCDQYRFEGEFFYNNSPFKSLTLNGYTIVQSGVSTYYSLRGATNTYGGMVNAFYDFIPSDSESYFVPYLGLGIGYTEVSTVLKFQFYDASGYLIGTQRLSQSFGTAAGQAIIGASYFLDDFASFALDFRYLTTKSKYKYFSERPQIVSLNLSFNGAFDFG